jgi:hypothetical protein
MSNIERWLDENTREVVAATDYDAMAKARDLLADTADRLIGERDDARQQLRGAVDLIRELHGILAPPEVDDPSAVPIAVDKIEAWLDAHGGQ